MFRSLEVSSLFDTKILSMFSRTLALWSLDPCITIMLIAGIAGIGSFFKKSSNLLVFLLHAQHIFFAAHTFMIWFRRRTITTEGFCDQLKVSVTSAATWIKNANEISMFRSGGVNKYPNSVDVGTWMTISRRSRKSIFCANIGHWNRESNFWSRAIEVEAKSDWLRSNVGC